MLGIDDGGIVLAYFLCIGSMLLCVGYGVLNWNKGLELECEEIDEEMKWEELEHEIENRL